MIFGYYFLPKNAAFGICGTSNSISSYEQTKPITGCLVDYSPVLPKMLYFI